MNNINSSRVKQKWVEASSNSNSSDGIIIQEKSTRMLFDDFIAILQKISTKLKKDGPYFYQVYGPALFYNSIGTLFKLFDFENTANTKSLKKIR